MFYTILDDDPAGVRASHTYAVDVAGWSPYLTPVGFVVRDFYEGSCHHNLNGAIPCEISYVR